jgi:aldehyde:ferredoxin oxidoreductase
MVLQLFSDESIRSVDNLGGVVYYEPRLTQWILEKINCYFITNDRNTKGIFAMAVVHVGGYAGKILRVDLSSDRFTVERTNELTLKSYIGGSGIGVKFLHDEVLPDVKWSDPRNRLMLFSGPLGGTRVPGSGTFSVVTKGALTNGATTTQANGFFGAYLKFSGFDGIILQGVAKKLVYLYIHDGVAELKDASHLAGKDTSEAESLIKRELGQQDYMMSVYAIGPAGENLVRYACIVGDKGHVAAHNGVGAVMGSKKLKAIAVSRGRTHVLLKDGQRFSDLSKVLRERILNDPQYDRDEIRQWGTLNIYHNVALMGMLLTKNYTTNVYDPAQLNEFCGEYIRGHYSPKLHPCWACPMRHCHTLRIPNGRHAGEVVEEPDYEGLVAWSTQIGQTDVTEAILLSDLVDRLGMDTNESSWVIGLVMECYEKGILTKADIDGLEMTWGNIGAVRTMLYKIARREGFGDLLAEGTMRAAQVIGKEAPSFAIHTRKGNTPRSHDHRLNWREMFDTCVSNTGTIESAWNIARPNFHDLGLSPLSDSFSPIEVSSFVAKAKWALLFEDSLGTCTFCTQAEVRTLAELVSAATGWNFGLAEASKVGLRTANLLRVFNLRCGISAELDAPSPRYGSIPVDGKFRGKSIAPVWREMLCNYYKLMGWDTETGKPLPETLEDLGLGHVITYIW